MNEVYFTHEQIIKNWLKFLKIFESAVNVIIVQICAK